MTDQEAVRTAIEHPAADEVRTSRYRRNEPLAVNRQKEIRKPWPGPQDKRLTYPALTEYGTSVPANANPSVECTLYDHWYLV